MDVASAQRIHHLARYFGVLAILCFLGYLATPFSYPLLLFLGPSLYLTYLLRLHGGFLVGVIPNQPFFNNLFLFFPLTFVYFGLVGFQLKNILNERGKLRLIVFTLFVAFVIYIHSLAFQEISLYWQGSSKPRPALTR